MGLRPKPRSCGGFCLTPSSTLVLWLDYFVWTLSSSSQQCNSRQTRATLVAQRSSLA